MRQFNKALALKIAVNACRILLAATFIFSGFIKANDPFGTVYKLQDYVASMLWFSLPEKFLLGCAVILAFFEFTLGINTLFAISRPKTSKFTVVFMTFMTLLTVYIAIANPVSDCGCFGDAIILSNGATLAKNIVLLAAAVLVARYYRLQVNFVGTSVKWLILLFSLCFIIGYSIFCVISLPQIDFRPYKVSTNLRELVSGRGEQKFDVKIIYEKDGKTMELTAEDDDPDSTWSYVETKRIPLASAATAVSTDFFILDADEEDITEDILEMPGYTFILIIPDLTNADEGCIDKVNEIYDRCQDEGIDFYCVTASTDESAQRYWTEHTGAEYEYYFSEDRLLKTVVRGNPGLLILKDGVILKKYSNYNLPGEDELAALIESGEEE